MPFVVLGGAREGRSGQKVGIEGGGEELLQTRLTGKHGTLLCGVGQGEPRTAPSDSVLASDLVRLS